MHTVCNTQWVLGSRKAWTWLAGLPYQHPPSYVCFHCFLAGTTELWSWNWGTPSHDCCCKLLGSKQICLPHEQKKCSMTASTHRTITISQDKSAMSCGEHVTHPCRSQLTVFKLGLKLSFPVTSWYLVLCEKLQSFPRGASRQASARFCVHAPVYHTVPRVQTADLFSLWRTDHTDQMPQRRAAFKRNKCLKMSKAPIMFCSMYIFAI